MNFKYIGEAVALLGIAYSIVRWLARNVGDADARSHALLEIDLVRQGNTLHVSRSGASPGGRSPKSPTGETIDREPVPAPPADPAMFDGAAAMFGIAREALEQMDPRERALLLSGYRAAREARRRSSCAGDAPPS